ncbi:MAG: VWA domain-containing protein [Gammaproteobacteria bacterium]|nr:MAG: VWA domain-containing protein [Gammaproteobacteria bacterium]TDJ37816.1 MAG: VWA domain-containing protein [Gammaproteobacteria bacterium]
MARKRFDTFSLAFLDVMSCGFGAVILVFLIINHATEVEFQNVNRDALSEIRRLDYEVETGDLNLAEIRQAIEATRKRIENAQQRRLTITDTLDTRRDELTLMQAETLARIEHLNQLKTDLEAREKDVERLQAEAEEDEGSNVRVFVGEGDRQYLTGMKIGGARILIAVDISASMLDDTIVNVIRRRNMDEVRQRAAPKWQRTIATVEWLSAQLPLDSEFQIIGFNTEAKPMLPESAGGWLEVSDADALNDSIEAFKEIIPSGGTSLENLAIALGDLSPLPDNVYLIIDSLPTQGTRKPRGSTVSGRQRMSLFRDAISRIPPNIPVNVILFPMEGDPLAAAAYWDLAQISGGAFIAPSDDWP